MIPILKVGSRSFAFKKTEDASRVLSLLAAAQPVEQTYHYKRAKYFFHPRTPDTDRSHVEIGLELVDPSQLCEAFSSDQDSQPDDPIAISRGRRLPARVTPRQITGGAQ